MIGLGNSAASSSGMNGGSGSEIGPSSAWMMKPPGCSGVGSSPDSWMTCTTTVFPFTRSR
jgi:hypothetical protein